MIRLLTAPPAEPAPPVAVAAPPAVLADGPPPDISYAADMAPDPAAAVNAAVDPSQDAPIPSQDAASAPQAGAAAPSVDPAAAVNLEAGAGSPDAPRPSVSIPNAIARAGIAGGLAWLAERGSTYAVRRFSPRNADGSRFRPGPATIRVTDEMLDKFGVSAGDRSAMGVSPTAPLEYPVSDVLAEGIRVELERLGFDKDLNLHPLLIIAVGLVAIPACQIMRSPDFADDGEPAEPEHEHEHEPERTPAPAPEPEPEHAPRRVQSLDELRGARAAADG